MKKFIKRIMALCALIVITACSSTVEDGTLESVSVTEPALLLFVGNTYDLDVEVLPSDAEQDVTWASTEPSIATVNQLGVVTGLSEGVATISVVSDVSEIHADFVPVIVVEDVIDLPIVGLSSSVSTVNLTIGETEALAVELSAIGVTSDVTWQSFNDSVATVTDEGVVTGVGIGVVDVRASWVLNAAVFYDFEIIVTSEDVSESSESEAGDVSEYESAADDALESGDFSAAVRQYELLLLQDPTHATANFVKGFGTVVELVDNDSIRDVVTFWEDVLGEESGLPEDSSFVLASSGSVVNPIQVIEGVLRLQGYSAQHLDQQEMFDEALIPIIDSAQVFLERLIDEDPVFNFSPTVTGSDSNTEIDLGDIYALLAVTNTFEFLYKFVLAYDWSAEDGDYPGGLAQVFADNENFGTLRAVGDNYMSEAMEALEKSIEYSFKAISETKSETDDQSDDVIDAEDLVDVSVTISGDDYTLTNADGRTYSINNLETLFSDSNYTLEYEDESGEVRSLVVNLGNFFNSPIEDFRDYFGIDGAVSLGEDAFPDGFDYTFSGLFPEFTSYDLMNEHALLSSENGITYYVPEFLVEFGDYRSMARKAGDYLVGVDRDSLMLTVWDPEESSDEGREVPLSMSGYDSTFHIAGLQQHGYIEFGNVVFYIDMESASSVVSVDTPEISNLYSLDAMEVIDDSLFLLVNEVMYVYDISTPELPTFDVSADLTTDISGSSSYYGMVENDGTLYIGSTTYGSSAVHSFTIESDSTLTAEGSYFVDGLDGYTWRELDMVIVGDKLGFNPQGGFVIVDISSAMTGVFTQGYDVSNVAVAAASDSFIVVSGSDVVTTVETFNTSGESQGIYRSSIFIDGDYTGDVLADVIGSKLFVNYYGTIYTKKL